MKKSVKLFLSCMIFIFIISTSVSEASSNKFGYYESGVKKYFTVYVNIRDTKYSSHTISGEYQGEFNE